MASTKEQTTAAAMNAPAPGEDDPSVRRFGISTSKLILEMAEERKVEPDVLCVQLKAELVAASTKKGRDGKPWCPEITNTHVLQYAAVAHEWGLNPFTKQISAWIKAGKLIVAVPIDGWVAIARRQPTFQRFEFIYHWVEGVEKVKNGKPNKDALEYITCRVWDSRYPEYPIAEIDEYMAECWLDTGPWGSHPFRMLRHKSLSQGVRVGYGVSGISDEDDAMRITADLEAEFELPELPPPPPSPDKSATSRLAAALEKKKAPEPTPEPPEPEKPATEPPAAPETQNSTCQSCGKIIVPATNGKCDGCAGVKQPEVIIDDEDHCCVCHKEIGKQVYITDNKEKGCCSKECLKQYYAAKGGNGSKPPVAAPPPQSPPEKSKPEPEPPKSANKVSMGQCSKCGQTTTRLELTANGGMCAFCAPGIPDRQSAAAGTEKDGADTGSPFKAPDKGESPQQPGGLDADTIAAARAIIGLYATRIKDKDVLVSKTSEAALILAYGDIEEADKWLEQLGAKTKKLSDYSEASLRVFLVQGQRALKEMLTPTDNTLPLS